VWSRAGGGGRRRRPGAVGTPDRRICRRKEEASESHRDKCVFVASDDEESGYYFGKRTGGFVGRVVRASRRVFSQVKQPYIALKRKPFLSQNPAREIPPDMREPSGVVSLPFPFMQDNRHRYMFLQGHGHDFLSCVTPRIVLIHVLLTSCHRGQRRCQLFEDREGHAWCGP
jgi:hypothetical protein